MKTFVSNICDLEINEIKNKLYLRLNNMKENFKHKGVENLFIQCELVQNNVLYTKKFMTTYTFKVFNKQAGEYTC